MESDNFLQQGKIVTAAIQRAGHTLVVKQMLKAPS